MKKNADLMYAIDFGTSNSLLTAASPTEIFAPIPLDPEAKDATVMRSLLYFPTMERCYYGSAAIDHYIQNQGRGRLIRSIKKFLPIRSFVGTWIENRPANLEDIISFFLREMRTRANQHFGQDVERVVLGRPAKYSPIEEDDKYAEFRMERAAKNAGFKEIHFCPEPVAAAFDFRTQLTEEKYLLVGDFGGGTSDFTVVKFHPGPHRPEDVLAIGGVALAGDVMDGAIMRYKLSTFFGSDVTYKVPFGTNILKMPVHLMEKICSPADIALLAERDIKEFLQKVKTWSLGETDRVKLDRLFCLIENQLGFSVFESIEKGKRDLSERTDTKVIYDYPTIEIEADLKRTEFETYIHENVDKIMTSLDDTVKAAGLKHEQIDIVCCTGGTAKIPLVSAELAKRFGFAKLEQKSPFHSVVRGLAHRAQQLL